MLVALRGRRSLRARASDAAPTGSLTQSRCAGSAITATTTRGTLRSGDPRGVDVERCTPAGAREDPLLGGGLELRLALRPAGAEEVIALRLDAPPRVFDRAAGPMRRARERPHRSARAVGARDASRRKDAREPRNPLRAPAFVAVPLGAHERDPARRVGHDGAREARGHERQHLDGVALDDAPPRCAADDIGRRHRMPPSDGCAAVAARGVNVTSAMRSHEMR